MPVLLAILAASLAMVGLVAGRAASALMLSRLLPPLGSIAQQSTLATAPSVTQAMAPEATAALPAAPPSRSFYKRQLPRDLVAFSSAEARHAPRGRQPLAQLSPQQPYAGGAAQGKRIFRAALDDGSVEGFFPLVQHFQTQSEPASCALGTLCMARGSVGGKASALAADAPRGLRRC